MHDTSSVRVRRGVWVGRRIKKYPQRLYLSLVLARNIAMTTQAPAASRAPMKEADDALYVVKKTTKRNYRVWKPDGGSAR